MDTSTNSENIFEVNVRIQTFHNWPMEKTIPGSKLAAAGFIYVQRPDSVQCVFCGGCIRDWEHDDKPMVKHKRYFPTCQFVLLNEGKIQDIDLTRSPFYESVCLPVHPDFTPKLERTTGSQMNQSGKYGIYTTVQ